MFYFVFVMYSYTTGGPFGLEDQVTTSGPGLTLLYDLFIPLVMVHSDFADRSRADDRDARRRRLLSLEPRRIR